MTVALLLLNIVLLLAALRLSWRLRADLDDVMTVLANHLKRHPTFSLNWTDKTMTVVFPDDSAIDLPAASIKRVDA